MSSNRLTVSLSPHIHSGDSTKRIMYIVLLALLPAFAVSVYSFGIGAIITTFTALVACLFFEWSISKFILKQKATIYDGSAAITAVLLAFNVPSTLPIWMMIVGSFVAIAIAKMSFGGLGQNPFNPALVGRVFMLMSFPADMTSWPEAVSQRMNYTDAVTGATPLAQVKEAAASGNGISSVLDQIPTYTDMFLGTISGSLGEVSAVAILLGAFILLFTKVISWHIPVSVLGSMILFSGILHLVDPELYIDPLFHLLAGGALLGAIFMATDMVTSPMAPKGMILFGVGIGIITIAIRVFGAYPEGMSFAILIMNAFVPLINKYMRPKIFGAK